MQYGLSNTLLSIQMMYLKMLIPVKRTVDMTFNNHSSQQVFCYTPVAGTLNYIRHHIFTQYFPTTQINTAYLLPSSNGYMEICFLLYFHIVCSIMLKHPTKSRKLYKAYEAYFCSSDYICMIHYVEAWIYRWTYCQHRLGYHTLCWHSNWKKPMKKSRLKLPLSSIFCNCITQ